ncbi:alpha/beta hydrolase [Mycolicibacterium sp.]|uniref:alpha/beta hydrolase n=1 Tax=Mycolicibacterium sp. TaxID=2320850 RepID=UPI001A26F152|nr:alpha/beta hydrolase [Mycolicibacterium sp.]MBJ7399310.1 alpha/beta hydrolase [Mycolicibacterium sp.]
MTAVQPEWVDDVLAGYRQATLPLGADPDGEGELFATLVRTADSTPSSSVVLAVHGYTDYFFNTELADHFTARGWRFYGLDSHRCGRSWREGQTPHFTTDLARYDRELEWAISVIAAENPTARVLVCGHSTGGLVVALWLDRVRQRGDTAAMGIAGLVLNSPFLDLNGPAILRTKVTSTAIGAVSKVRKTRVLRGSGTGGYGLTLHREYHGEFDYDLRWKPLGGFPVTVGWIHAIRRGQAKLHRGLDVGVPNLVLRSDHSVAETAETDMLQRGDAVLDVAHIARWAGCLGNRTTSVPVTDAKHDVFLSLAEPRAAAYTELERWLSTL